VTRSVRDSDQEVRTMPRTVTVGLDGSCESLAAAEWAAREAGLRPCKPVVLGVDIAARRTRLEPTALAPIGAASSATGPMRPLLRHGAGAVANG
jgi:hypothetical protein